MEFLSRAPAGSLVGVEARYVDVPFFECPGALDALVIKDGRVEFHASWETRKDIVPIYVRPAISMHDRTVSFYGGVPGERVSLTFPK